jgi:hypothetical protein
MASGDGSRLTYGQSEGLHQRPSSRDRATARMHIPAGVIRLIRRQPSALISIIFDP